MSGGRARRPGAHDAGSSSVLVLALGAVVALVAAVLVGVTAAAGARARAASAADLGALAAAARADLGQAAACARAGAVVERAGVRLVRCALAGDVVDVEVAVRPAGRLGALGPATGRARAGPAG